MPLEIVRSLGVLQVQVIAANSGDPAFFESPKYLLIKSPIVKRFRDRKRFVHAAAGFKTAIHEFGLPFHEWKAALGIRALPFVEKICAVNLRSRIGAGFIRAKCTGDSREHDLGWTQIDRIFPARDPDEILQAAKFAIGCSPIKKHSVVAGITK